MRAVLFDMDGVILDSMPFHVMAWQEALREFGLSVAEELLYLHEGAIEPENAVKIFQGNGCSMDRPRFHEIFRRQREIFGARYRSGVKPYREVPALLDRLRSRGWTLALVTSSHEEVLAGVLPREIRDQMAHVVTGDRVRRRKPFPEPYLAAVTALGRKAADCVVVENAPAGIRAAKAASLRCVALTTTLAREHLSGADTILSSHTELGSLLLGD